MRNTSNLARYMMMYPNRDQQTESRSMDNRTGRTRYDDGRYAPMRNEAYPAMNERIMPETAMPYENKPMMPRNEWREDDEWEMAYSGEPQNDREHRIIGFASASKSKNASSPMNWEMAEEWMSGIVNEDGTKGAHWSLDEVKRLMQQKGVECDPVKLWVAMNAEYSDRQKVNKKYGVDRPEYYMDSAIAYWLKDADAVKDKLSAYYTYVVKH